MKYEDIVESYREMFSTLPPKLRKVEVYNVFQMLQHKGLTKADLTSKLIDNLRDVVSDRIEPEIDAPLFGSDLVNRFMSLCEHLDKSTKPVKEDQKKEDNKTEGKSENGKNIYDLKPEDFPEKKGDKEFLEMLGLNEDYDPDIGDPGE